MALKLVKVCVNWHEYSIIKKKTIDIKVVWKIALKNHVTVLVHANICAHLNEI